MSDSNRIIHHRLYNFSAFFPQWSAYTIDTENLLDGDFSSVLCWPVQYADPVADLLDRWGIFRVRLFRDSCIFHRGNFVKVNEAGNFVIIDCLLVASFLFLGVGSWCLWHLNTVSRYLGEERQPTCSFLVIMKRDSHRLALSRRRIYLSTLEEEKSVIYLELCTQPGSVGFGMLGRRGKEWVGILKAECWGVRTRDEMLTSYWVWLHPPVQNNASQCQRWKQCIIVFSSLSETLFQKSEKKMASKRVMLLLLFMCGTIPQFNRSMPSLT